MRERAPDHDGIQLTYVESSALVAGLLESDAGTMRTINAALRCVTAAVTFAEAKRAVVRARATRRVSHDVAAAVTAALEQRQTVFEPVAISDAILARAARPFPAEPVRTLDAIHLATIEALGVPAHRVQVVTRDARVANNARALGYVVVGA